MYRVEYFSVDLESMWKKDTTYCLFHSTVEVTRDSNGGYTLVTLPRIVTPYGDSVDGTRARVTDQNLVTR
jgi:hypothetical protein